MNSKIETYQVMTSETFVVMLYHIEPSSRIATIDKTFKPNNPTILMKLLYCFIKKGNVEKIKLMINKMNDIENKLRTHNAN
jgi:hypothetical protein